jgi:hypothetical protein
LVQRSRWFAVRGVALLALLSSGARPLRAQGSLVDHLGLDRLQIVSLGASIGRIIPYQVEPAKVFAVSADYGEFAPNWRIVVGASFWSSQYRESVVQAFVDELNQNSTGPGTAQVTASRVSLYDVTFSGEARYAPVYSGEIKPFLGVGLAAHVINAEGSLIRNTFVERALDDVGTGVFATAGVTLRLISHLGIEGSVRGDLMSGLRSSQLRAGATYFFGSVHGTSGARGDSQ